MPAGRPTKYKEEYAKLAYKLCLLRATDEDLARTFEVDEATINRWKLDHPSFCESIKEGREIADAEVAQALKHRAVGYYHNETKVLADGTKVETTKYHPPDTAAAFIWLKNRQPKKWRDKQEHEIGGTGGGNIKISFVDPDDDE